VPAKNLTTLFDWQRGLDLNGGGLQKGPRGLSYSFAMYQETERSGTESAFRGKKKHGGAKAGQDGFQQLKSLQGESRTINWSGEGGWGTTTKKNVYAQKDQTGRGK